MRIVLNLITLSLTMLFSQSFAQINFNQYKTLKSQGNIPEDFSSSTHNKIDKDLENRDHNLSKSKEKIFLQGIHYGIDDILHSGLVIYGDEVSNYVRNIAHHLLKDREDLKTKLRFYTIKSNETNALSTDQGIIFVTTGLIAQLANEAQLAFVLAHEISHYTEKHVVESFEYQIENRNNNIRELSIYSKEKELEADRLGLKIYYEAGYSKEELNTAFDVLKYSYLPFDEEEFPKDYFNKKSFYIPSAYFSDSTFEIKATEDYDDSKSSHPNIKSRKDQVDTEIGKLKDWGNQVYIIGEKEFENVRQVCRFESVRTDIINNQYGDALYSIFILEKSFPNSSYLKHMKAQAWLGLAQNKQNGSMNQTIKKKDELEGESARLHEFLKKLKKDAINSIALREIYNIYLENKEDKETQAIAKYLIESLVDSKSFKIESYSKQNYLEAKKKAESIKPEEKEEKKETDEEKKKSKYDKIKTKKNIDNAEKFDSTKFYLYGLNDVIEDQFFKDIFFEKQEQFDKKEKEEEEYALLSKRERRKFNAKKEANELRIGSSEFIVVEPMVNSFRNGDYNQVKSELLKEDFSKVMNEVAQISNTRMYVIDRENLIKGTDVYNERSTLFTFMTQISGEDNFNVFPVDFDNLKEIQTNYGTSKILFPFAEHAHINNFNFSTAFLLMICYPVLPFYLSHLIMKSNYTELGIIIFDIEQGKVLTGTDYTFVGKPKKYHLGAHVYNVISQLKLDPIK